MLRPRAAPLLLALALLLSGCSGSDEDSGPDQPDESAFREGSCRSLAPAVLAIGRDATALGEGATPAMDVRDRLAQAQEALQKGQEGIDPSIATVVEELIVRVGFVRIRSDGNTFTPDLATSTTRAYDAVVAACTGAAGGTTPPAG